MNAHLATEEASAQHCTNVPCASFVVVLDSTLLTLVPQHIPITTPTTPITHHHDQQSRSFPVAQAALLITFNQLPNCTGLHHVPSRLTSTSALSISTKLAPSSSLPHGLTSPAPAPACPGPRFNHPARPAWFASETPPPICCTPRSPRNGRSTQIICSNMFVMCTPLWRSWRRLLHHCMLFCVGWGGSMSEIWGETEHGCKLLAKWWSVAKRGWPGWAAGWRGGAGRSMATEWRF